MNPPLKDDLDKGAQSEFERLQILANKTLSPDPSLKRKPASIWQLIYDIVMLAIIVIDLTIISIDNILTSQFAQRTAEWIGASGVIEAYTLGYHNVFGWSINWHLFFGVAGGFFTLFLIAELLVRWLLAIISKQYLRWFFFPFVHWYEVLGCLPQLRALRLLRAVFISRKLYQMGYRFLPEKWLATGRFYYGLVLEELSDRVILSATDNIRQQFSGTASSQNILDTALNDNRPQIQAMIASMLRQELTPQLQKLAKGPVADELAGHVGASVQDALANTPELRRYLRMIPIAGKLIESQLHDIGQHVGENLVESLTNRLTTPTVVDPIIESVSEAIANVDLNNSELEAFIKDIVNDSLTAFEEQVRVQQWKHQEYLRLEN